ncbi:unnamed protein product [Sphagnum jensenii]|uniref:Uncharacterized protein n=2 Tax=Sphagnum jensenii TaxID=128206 RepID=A0ABP0VDQ9_9BRYO
MVAQRAFALDVSQVAADPVNNGLEADFQMLGELLRSMAAHTTLALENTHFGLTGIFQWIALITAVYLLILDRTNWRTNLLTALLVPYVALNLPDFLFNVLRSDIGRWIAFIAVVIRLFFAPVFPNIIHGDLELPAATILLIVTAPALVLAVKDSIIGVGISLVIGIYLFVQHLNNSGGWRQAFGEAKGGAHTVGIVFLFLYPLYFLFFHWLL